MTSDTKILIIIISILVLVNFAAYFINLYMGGSGSLHDIESQTDSLDDANQAAADGDTYLFLKTLSGIFLWGFGTIPVWLDLILLMFRTTAYLLTYKLLRGIGS